MKIGVVVFPGSNCDRDAHGAVVRAGQEAVWLWHGSAELQQVEAIVLPGGFSYGDYLRTGAIARFSPVMGAVRRFAAGGGPVLGICNGFQILCECGLLPGALLRNASLRFVSRPVWLRVENISTPFTRACAPGQRLRMPVAHGEGNYFAPDAELDELERRRQVVFRYVDASGDATAAANPNGSARNTAGICNRDGNVVGLMPHPERALEAALGSSDGLELFRSLLRAAAGAATSSMAARVHALA
ncbi:MAG: phosphoribosylformylglycinamidine synthase subunit PurQ [Terriglobales bacterium]